MRASARSAISRTSASSVRVAWTVSSSAGTALALPDPAQQLGGEGPLPPLARGAQLLDVLVHQPEPVVHVEQPLGPLGGGPRLLLEHGLERLEVEQRREAVDLGLEQGPLAHRQLGHQLAVQALPPR